jgi:hypothetical protein
MPVTQVNTPDGRVVDVDHPDGALERDILSYAAQQYSIDPSIAYEPTTALGALGEAGKRLVGGIATGTARVGTGLAELIPGVDDEAAQAVQRDVDEFVADKLVYDPAYDENYVAQLGEVVGEMGPMIGSLFLPGGIPARATQLATMIGPAVSEGGMDRAEYEERTGEALSTAERLTAKGADVGLGMLERLGIPTRILKGLPRGFFDRPDANPFLRRIESMIASGTQEGVQEVGQGIARDLTTLAIYDPDRKIADSVMDDFALGGGAGAVLDLAIGLAQTPLKGRKGRAPKPIEDMTEKEIADEQELRDQFEMKERARRESMDASLTALDEIGPPAPSDVREDPLDPTLVDSTLPVEDMTAQVVKRLGSRLPVGKTFSVGSLGNEFFAEVDGEQYGPVVEDPTVAQELSNRLTATSQQLAKSANIEYIVENSGIEYTEQQAGEVRQFGRFIPSPQERVISAEDANLATGRDVASVINRQKADRGDAETEVFTLEEVRAANKGDLGNLGDVLAAKDADFLAFRDDPVTPQAPLSPTQPRQPALGRRQRALRSFSSSFDNLISSERAFTDLLASKRIDVTVDSEPFRGLVKRIIGKTPAKNNPLDKLSANERRYLYHRVRKLPSFQGQATSIPDFSTKTPDADLVRIARRQTEVDRSIQVDPIRVLDDLVGRGVIPQDVADSLQDSAGAPPRFNPSAILDALVQRGSITPEVARSLKQSAPSAKMPQAELSRVEQEARRTARPIERAEEGVPVGQELVPYDLDQSALGQQLRDALKRFGIDDQYATRMVERVGNARRDSDGNIYIAPIKKRDDGGIAAGSAQAGAKVIQVGLDAVMADVNSGMSYDQAVAKIMNHEILHALRAMDLFTAEEYSLLERLSRKYQKPGEGKTYGQWAVDTYGDISAVKLQEEAIAEMISDALTTGVVMDGDVKKPTGKPRSIFNKIINFFKSLVGVAKNNDVDSFRSLVDSIQSGAVGRRERGVVRTPFRTDLVKKEIPERGITVEDIDLETGKRGRPLTARQVINNVKQDLGDAPEAVDEAMLSLRLDRAAEQGFDTSEVFYHGSMSPDIKRFKARTGMGVVAGHFTRSPALANTFVADVAREDEAATVYPVFLREFIADNETGKSLFAVREAGEAGALQNIADSLDKPFAVARFDHPQLFQDLTDYFKRQLEIAQQNGSFAGTKLRSETQIEVASNYLEGRSSLDEAAYELAEIFHERSAPYSFRQVKEEPDDVDFEQLEALAPYIKEAGFAGYKDIEFFADPYSAIAIFDPADVKGVFAEYDPTSVSEGMQYEDDIMFSLRRLEGMPESFDVDGQAVEFGYHQPAVDAARRYTEKAGIRYEPLTIYAPIDQKMARKIAIEYDLMEDAPNNPEVKAAYDAMIDETLAQYEEIMNAGLTVQFIKGDDPYGNPRNAILDVINRNHMSVFSTRDGYGMDGITRKDLANNPMLRKTPFRTADGDPMLANDVFRVVHDYFGHIKNGVGFRARGEENAWQSHAAMYSPLARRAMTSETRGQNSWVNFGPEAAFNATASGANTVYAEQKMGLLPLWVSEEARQSDPRRADLPVFQEGLQGAIDADGKLQLSHFARKRLTRTDPTMAGRGADRARRYSPKGTYFGIVKADENGYRREAILGDVENTFSVDPLLVYPLDKDPYGLEVTNPAGNLNWDDTLAALNNAGYIGFRVNNRQLGKVVFINQPLISDEVVAEPKQKPVTKDIQTQRIAPRQTITPDQANEAVDKNIASIAEDVKGVPRFSVKASEEAQYVAQNPDSALEADEPMFSVRGNIPAVDKLTKGPDREESNGKVFMRATGTGELGTFFTKLKQGALDRYAPLAKYYQNIPELRELEADSSAVAAALFSDRSKGILASAVKYGVPVYRGGLTRVEEFTHDGETYRGLIGVMSLIYNKDVGDLRKLAQAYAMVQRGDYLKGKNKLTPVDAKSRKEVLDAVDALTDADGYNPVKKWHDVWSAYNNQTIDFLKATGMLNDETADVWKGSSYIPFYRTDASEDALPNVAKGVFGDLTRMSEFRAYQGSDQAVDVGLVESVVLNLSAAIEMGMKNVAQQRITRDMQNMGLARQIKASKAAPKGVNAIDFKVNGKRVRFEIDDNLIFDSMNIVGTGYAEQAAIKYLGAPANVLRELVTRDPGFMIANMMRDTLSTWTTSGASFVPVLSTVKGLRDGIERLEKLGVVGGYDFAIDKADIVDFYEAENKRRTEQMTPFNMLSRLWNWSGRATTGSDAATRNAVYNDVLARTGNEAEAAFQAMEIINFSRRGANPIVRVIAAAIPFLNARFQGLDVFMRAALGNYTTRREEPPAKGQLRLAYRGGLLTGLTALYYLLVSDEDWYKEQDEHTREMNWLAPTDSGVPFRFPIPFEVGLLFKTIPEAIMANYMGDQSDRELRQTLQRGVVSTLEVNPLAIQAVGPLLETYFNYDSFTGRPIVPFYVDKVTPGLAGGIYSTQLATDIGEALNINPLKIDHVVSGYTGTLGSYVISLSDALYKEAFDRGTDRPAKTIFQYPVLKRLFAQKEGGGLRADAYDLFNDVDEVVTTINTLRKERRTEELEAYIAARSHILALKGPVYTVKKMLDQVRNQKRAVQSSDLDPEVKTQMLEDLDASLNEYLKVVPKLKQMADAPFIQGTY